MPAVNSQELTALEDELYSPDRTQQGAPEAQPAEKNLVGVVGKHLQYT